MALNGGPASITEISTRVTSEQWDILRNYCDVNLGDHDIS